MKEMLAGFPPYRESAGPIRSRLQPALNCLADTQIFILNPLADSDRFRVVLLPCRAGDIGKVKIENDAAVVNVHRGTRTEVALPRVKGHEKYYFPYVRYMTAADAQEAEAARVAITESFEARNRDRRFKDWIGLDGDGERSVRWDFRLYAIEAGRIRHCT